MLLVMKFRCDSKLHENFCCCRHTAVSVFTFHSDTSVESYRIGLVVHNSENGNQWTQDRKIVSKNEKTRKTDEK